jgi:hypothetical protein
MMARPLKVSYEVICERYKDYLYYGVRFPVARLAREYSVSKRTINRKLSQGVAKGILSYNLIDTVPFQPKQQPTKQEVVVLLTGLPYGTWT